jgi:hypothetical protein
MNEIEMVLDIETVGKVKKRRDKTNDREDSPSYGSNRTINGIPITG